MRESETFVHIKIIMSTVEMNREAQDNKFHSSGHFYFPSLPTTSSRTDGSTKKH
jgi:hypothetical protein